MDLVYRDADFIAKALQDGATFMLCGALAMQQDVEQILERICSEKLNQSFNKFKANGQFLTDCY